MKNKISLAMNKRVILCITCMFLVMVSHAQEAVLSHWGYGLETSSGVVSQNRLPNAYSVSVQGLHDIGSGLSLDFISDENDDESGLLVSAFLGWPINKYFIPYIGGGLGASFHNGTNDFAWKADGGISSWLTNILYVKAGASYDNIRNDFSISVGIGFKFEKSVTSTYRNADGSTFQRTWTKYLWQDNSTFDRIYNDTLEYSEVVNTYQKTTSSSSYTPAQYNLKTSGGETTTTEIREGAYGPVMATATTRTPRKSEYVKTQDASVTTRYYVYNITVTRKWYTRTWYYKDRAPTTEQVYQDVESAVLVNSFSETERR